ncbi:MAG: hypothetical protein WAK82_28300 [Streptosporangiaceae bacterium]
MSATSSLATNTMLAERSGSQPAKDWETRLAARMVAGFLPGEGAGKHARPG